MRAINLYSITRKINDEDIALYEQSLSDREEPLNIRKDEIQVIKLLVDQLISIGIVDRLGEWFYSFSIPQISKEFDLLKIDKNKKIVNVEIKGMEVDEQKIFKQLKKNKYYLSHITSEIYSFTCVREREDSIKIYRLVEDSLEECTICEIANALKEINDPIDEGIERLFRPSDFLISPFNSPDKFLDRGYFLTSQQQDIKGAIISSDNKLWGITGGAGTGKTLLLYDIAISLSENNKVGIVHCGTLNSGQIRIDSSVENLSIVEAKSVDDEWLSTLEVICVDETQRIYPELLSKILTFSKESDCISKCVFSYDPIQVLSKKERNDDAVGILSREVDFLEKKLTKTIRTNKEILAFVRNMIRLRDKPSDNICFKNIDIIYANDVREAHMIISLYERRNFKIISYTVSKYYPNSIDSFQFYENSHHVLGQEFDNVLIYLDRNFFYDANGDLTACTHPNPNYLFPKLLFQNITRARERVCVLIIDNPNLFSQLLKVKNKLV